MAGRSHERPSSADPSPTTRYEELPLPKAPTFENALSFAQDLIRIPSPPGRRGRSR